MDTFIVLFMCLCSASVIAGIALFVIPINDEKKEVYADYIEFEKMYAEKINQYGHI